MGRRFITPQGNWGRAFVHVRDLAKLGVQILARIFLRVSNLNISLVVQSGNVFFIWLPSHLVHPPSQFHGTDLCGLCLLSTKTPLTTSLRLNKKVLGVSDNIFALDFDRQCSGSIDTYVLFTRGDIISRAFRWIDRPFWFKPSQTQSHHFIFDSKTKLKLKTGTV